MPFRLIDSGQHAALLEDLRVELGVAAPSVRLGGTSDVNSIPQALAWSARIGWRALRPNRLRREVFGTGARLCIVHGDTPSTLLAALLARRAGLEVVHLEAGLRSHNLLNPFPEELIRILVMRASGTLFAPDDTAVANLRAMGVKGTIVQVPGNTSVDALRASLRELPAPASGPVVVTMHRVENLHRRDQVDGFVDLVLRIAVRWKVQFVVHGPTEAVLLRTGHDETLRAAGVEMVPLVPHREFSEQLAAAPLVVTDGGSVQEECALLGVPTLLWRHHTERADGLGANVLLLHGDPDAADPVLADPGRWRYPPRWQEGRSPAESIVDHLVIVLGLR